MLISNTPFFFEKNLNVDVILDKYTICPFNTFRIDMRSIDQLRYHLDIKGLYRTVSIVETQ